MAVSLLLFSVCLAHSPLSAEVPEAVSEEKRPADTVETRLEKAITLPQRAEVNYTVSEPQQAGDVQSVAE